MSSMNSQTAKVLRSYVARVEHVEGEINDLNADKKEIYAEAKALGFDVSVLKKVIARRRVDRASVQETDAMLELYEAAVNSVTMDQLMADPLDA